MWKALPCLASSFVRNNLFLCFLVFTTLLRYGCTVEAYDGIGNNRVSRRSGIKTVCTLGFSQLFILHTPILHDMRIVTNVFIGCTP